MLTELTVQAVKKDVIVIDYNLPPQESFHIGAVMRVFSIRFRDGSSDEGPLNLFDCEIIHETAAAFKFQSPSIGEFWLPKSVCFEESRIFESGVIAVILPSWFKLQRPQQMQDDLLAEWISSNYEGYDCRNDLENERREAEDEVGWELQDDEGYHPFFRDDESYLRDDKDYLNEENDF